MHFSIKYLSLAASTLLLAACASKNSAAPAEQPADKDSVATAATPAPTASTACTLLADYAGAGKNIVYRCDVKAILKAGVASSELTNMPTSFGSGGQFRTNATANAFSKDPGLSCERAVTNALNNLQNRVVKDGGRRLTNVVAYKAGTRGRFDQSYLPAGQADCIVATFQSRVVMRGSVAK